MTAPVDFPHEGPVIRRFHVMTSSFQYLIIVFTNGLDNSLLRWDRDKNRRHFANDIFKNIFLNMVLVVWKSFSWALPWYIWCKLLGFCVLKKRLTKILNLQAAYLVGSSWHSLWLHYAITTDEAVNPVQQSLVITRSTVFKIHRIDTDMRVRRLWISVLYVLPSISYIK